MKKAKVVFVKSRKKPWRVTYPHGKTVYFVEEEDARNLANEINCIGEHALSPKDRQKLAYLKLLCDDAGLDVQDVVMAGIDSLSETPDSINSPKLSDAIVAFLDQKKQQMVREKTLEGFSIYLKPLGIRYGNLPVNQITPDILKKFLINRWENETTRDNAKKVWSNFFRVCLKRKWIFDLPTEFTWDRVLTDQKRIGYLTPDDVRKILFACQDNLINAFALGFFAGVRTEELLRMQYQFVDGNQIYGVDYQRKRISLHPSWTKNRKYRELVDLPDNLWVWLDYANKVTIKVTRLQRMLNPLRHRNLLRFNGSLVPMNKHNWQVIGRKIRERAGVTIWPHNAMRHSFGCHGIHRGAEWCISTMGHLSEYKVYAKHYHESGVSKEQSGTYFSILPPKKVLLRDERIALLKQ